MEITQEQIVLAAHRYRLALGWDQKRNVIRFIFNRSGRHWADNLHLFATILGIPYQEVIARGGITPEYREAKYRKKRRKKQKHSAKPKQKGPTWFERREIHLNPCFAEYVKDNRFEIIGGRGAIGKRTKGGKAVNIEAGKFFG
jgi:hypothetical protein